MDGRLLSAAELARRVGTSKARILAYEKGTSVPEASRVALLAHVFGVTPRKLYPLASDGGPHSLKELRCFAGLTAATLAARVGISRASYREVELLALLPTRDDGTLPLRLARELGVSVREIHLALDRHPEADRRRRLITGLLDALFQRARTHHVPAVVNPDETELLTIAHLLRRPPTAVCRLVNYELSRFRETLRRQAVAEIEHAYAQSEQQAAMARYAKRTLHATVSTGAERAAAALVRFLAEAMSSRQWRVLAFLLEQGTLSRERAADFADEETWVALQARGFVSLGGRDRGAGGPRAAEGETSYTVTAEGVRQGMARIRHYGCLYPRVPAPVALADTYLRSQRRRGLSPETTTELGLPYRSRTYGR